MLKNGRFQHYDQNLILIKFGMDFIIENVNVEFLVSSEGFYQAKKKSRKTSIIKTYFGAFGHFSPIFIEVVKLIWFFVGIDEGS